MSEVVKKGTLRLEVDKLEIRDYNLQRIITDTLINNGYDVDVTPIDDDISCHHRPQGQLLSVYEVRN